jgi:hypothetical protein
VVQQRPGARQHECEGEQRRREAICAERARHHGDQGTIGIGT